MLIITDLDNTLIDTRKLKPLRDERRWREVYNNFDKTYLNPDVKEKFEGLLDNYEIVIVTSSPKYYAKNLLKHHNFLTDCKIIAYHDTKNHKPHPEPYIKALNTIEGNHNNIFVFGDDEKDIKPALDLGFITIGVEWYVKYNGNVSPHYLVNHPEEINKILRG